MIKIEICIKSWMSWASLPDVKMLPRSSTTTVTSCPGSVWSGQSQPESHLMSASPPFSES